MCIVHLIRQSWHFVDLKEHKAVAADLKLIYGSAALKEAEIALATLAEKWDKSFPMLSQIWL